MHRAPQAAARRGGQQSCRQHRAAVAAALPVLLAAAALLLLLLPAPASAGLFSSRGSSGGGFRTSSYGSSYKPSSSSYGSSGSYKPVSSGYGYKPTYKPSGGGTPSFAAPKPGASAPFSSGSYAPPSNFGNSFLGGRPGAGSYGSAAGRPAAAGMMGGMGGAGAGAAASSLYRPSRPSKMTSLAVPLAVGAGAGALTSAAFRSGQRSCGDGRLECFQGGCDQARRQCAPARDFTLRRVRCPPSAASAGFAECWAAGGDSVFSDGKLDKTDSPAFLCMGKARPRSRGDVVANCFDYSKKAAGSAVADDDHVTAEQLLNGDPALPSTQAIAATGYSSGAAAGLGRRAGPGAVVVVAAALAAAAAAAL